MRVTIRSSFGVEREVLGTRSVPRCALLRARRSDLTRWHSCLSHCRTPAGPQVRAQGVRRLRAVQGCRLFLRIASQSLARERQGLCPLVPETETDAPGWRASPAGPRQGIGLRFSLPLPSSPEGRRHGRAMLARDKSSAGDGDATHRRRNSAMVFYQEHPDPELARNAPCLCAGCGITAMDFN